MKETKIETLNYCISRKKKAGVKFRFLLYRERHLKNCYKFSENTLNEYRLSLTDNILDFQIFDYSRII